MIWRRRTIRAPTLGADGRGMRYYNILNLPYCVDGRYGFVNNGEKVDHFVRSAFRFWLLPL